VQNTKLVLKHSKVKSISVLITFRWRWDAAKTCSTLLPLIHSAGCNSICKWTSY